MASPQRLYRSTQSISPRQPTTQTLPKHPGHQPKTPLPRSAFHMTQSDMRENGAPNAHGQPHKPLHPTTAPIVRMTPVDSSHLDYKRPDTPPPGPPVSPQLRGMIVLDNNDIDDGAGSLASGLSEDLGYLAAELERVATIVERDSKTKTKTKAEQDGAGSGNGDGDGEIEFWKWVRGVRCLGRGKVEDGVDEEGKREGEEKVEVEGQHKLRKVVWTI